MQQPVARKEIVTDTYFGTTIADPYRWMEDWKGEELRSWVDAQGAYTRAYLDALPERQALAQRIAELGDASPAFYNFSFTGEHFFYLRRDPGEKPGKLIVRKGKMRKRLYFLTQIRWQARCDALIQLEGA